MCVRDSLSGGIHAAAFYYYKAQPQPITAVTRLRSRALTPAQIALCHIGLRYATANVAYPGTLNKTA